MCVTPFTLRFTSLALAEDRENNKRSTKHMLALISIVNEKLSYGTEEALLVYVSEM